MTVGFLPAVRVAGWPSVTVAQLILRNPRPPSAGMEDSISVICVDDASDTL